MSARPSSDTQTRAYEIAIVGNDMLLAALPGRAVQLAHAILAAGYDLVVPVSWGEELVAEHVLRELEHAPSHAMVFCSCPLVRQRLLASGSEIVPHLLSTVAPPVATARYLRALQPEVAMHITYLGACPGAREHSIDAQVQPRDFLGHLEERSIAIVRQPMVFESMVPPDRRRHWSVPGGAPSIDAMAACGLATRFVTVGPDVALEVAEAILAAERVLLDVAQTQGCACAGAVEVHQVEGSREAVIALEPPRSHLPVIDVEPRIAVAQALPHLTGHSGYHATRPVPTPSHVTSIQDAARGRAERPRIAITPAHISPTDLRTRPPVFAPEPAPTPPPARRAPVAVPRSEVSKRRSEPSTAAPTAGADAAATTRPVPVIPDAPVVAPVEVVPPREEAPVVPAAASVVEVHAEAVESQAPTTTHRRTTTYEMRHVARLRSAHPGETPRVPRAYGAVRSRVRGGDSVADVEGAHPEPLAPVAAPVASTPPALDVATAIPVGVERPPDAATHSASPADPPAPRGPAFAPRLERHGVTGQTRGRTWLLTLSVLVVAGAIVWALFWR